MTRIFLSARYSRLTELNEYAQRLRDNGFIVDCRWLNGSHQLIEGDPGAFGEKLAREDCQDLIDSDIVLCFTEQPRHPSTNRGGRHVEFGMAIALKKKILVIGWIENTFHCLPEVRFSENFDDALGFLLMCKQNQSLMVF